VFFALNHLLHFYRGQFVPMHTGVYQIHAQQRTVTSDKWYRSLVTMVETCEDDPTYGQLFKLSTSDKRDLYARWEILQEHRAGHVASAIELIDRLICALHARVQDRVEINPGGDDDPEQQKA